MNIEPGDYWGKFDPSTKKLLLQNKKAKKDGEILQLDVTFEELLVILTMAGGIIDESKLELARGSKFSSKEKGFVAHHVIPVDVWANSSLTRAAINHHLFHKDHDTDINRFLLSVTFHKGSHPRYSKFVHDILEEEWDDKKDDLIGNNGAMQQLLIDIIDYLRDEINRWIEDGICSINDV
ncbi:MULTISPECIES: AHH domain-containing protein [unclassified Microcoleus]|uniref:AHH domain-containing protein n=1 Tax=unclassified Microcoleus TaxID=2642155 RepID=UPI002FCFFFEB